MSKKKKAITITIIAVVAVAVVMSAVYAVSVAYQGRRHAVSNPEVEGVKAVEQVGELPDAFQPIVEENIFHDVTAFESVLLKDETLPTNENDHIVDHQIHMMDFYGKDIAVYSFTSDDDYQVSFLTATDDGGFLFALGFQDYSVSQNVWASDNGFASRVIKCDKTGEMQFDISFDGVEGDALKYCIEKNSLFYLFGTIETPETKTRGVHSPTDVFLMVLDQNGREIKRAYIAGSDYDDLSSVEMVDGEFVLSVSSQSSDGDFAGSNPKGYPVSWVVTLNDDLEIMDKSKGKGRDTFDIRLGEVDGVPIYSNSNLFNGFDAGTPTAVIDYGDFYLIVSENDTGVYENTPSYISSVWYYTETVYSAYNKNGDLLFRASTDSSPDYNVLASIEY